MKNYSSCVLEIDEQDLSGLTSHTILSCQLHSMQKQGSVTL